MKVFSSFQPGQKYPNLTTNIHRIFEILRILEHSADSAVVTIYYLSHISQAISQQL